MKKDSIQKLNANIEQLLQQDEIPLTLPEAGSVRVKKMKRNSIKRLNTNIQKLLQKEAGGKVIIRIEQNLRAELRIDLKSYFYNLIKLIGTLKVFFGNLF